MTAVESTLKDTLQASYFNSSEHGLKTAMFNRVEQALGEMVRSGHLPTISKAEMQRPVQNKSLTHTIVHSVLSNTGIVFLIAERMGNLVDRAIDEHSLRDIEKASTITADTDPFIELAPLHPTKLSKIPSDFESHEEPLRSRCCRCSSSRRNLRKK